MFLRLLQLPSAFDPPTTHPSGPCVGVPAVVPHDEGKEDKVSEDEPVRVGEGLHVRRHALVSVVD